MRSGSTCSNGRARPRRDSTSCGCRSARCGIIAATRSSPPGSRPISRAGRPTGWSASTRCRGWTSTTPPTRASRRSRARCASRSTASAPAIATSPLMSGQSSAPTRRPASCRSRRCSRPCSCTTTARRPSASTPSRPASHRTGARRRTPRRSEARFGASSILRTTRCCWCRSAPTFRARDWTAASRRWPCCQNRSGDAPD